MNFSINNSAFAQDQMTSGTDSLVQSLDANLNDKQVQQLKLERLISGISTRLVNVVAEDLEETIVDALGKVARVQGLNRAYALLFGENENELNTYEWTAEGVPKLMQTISKIEPAFFSWSTPRMKSGRRTAINDLSKLPDKIKKEFDVYLKLGVKALAIAPLVSSKKVLGVVGMADSRPVEAWTGNFITILGILGELFANAIARCKAEKELEYRLRYEQVMAGITADFASTDTVLVDLDLAISSALKKLGTFLEADGVFVLNCSGGDDLCRNTHYWKNTFSAVIDTALQNTTWLKDLFGEGETINIDSLAKHSPTLSNKILGAEALLAAKWKTGDLLTGCLCVFSKTRSAPWADDQLRIVKMTANLIGSHFGRIASHKDAEKQRSLIGSLMDSNTDRVLLMDSKAKYLSANRAALDDLQTTSESIVGKDARQVLGGEFGQWCYEDDLKIIQTGIPSIGQEMCGTVAGGKEVFTSVTRIPLFNEKNEVVGLVCSVRDITNIKQVEEEKRRLEQQVIQAQKTESLGMMCGGIAHDFNNYLMGIIGNVSLALMELEENSVAWTNVKQAETVAMLAAELTAQLLAYSGKAETEMKVTNLSSLVADMGQLLQISLSAQTKIIIQAAKDLSDIMCDPSQIRQVIMNLIINASDAIGSSDGRITITTGEIYCDQKMLSRCAMNSGVSEGKYVFVTVDDTGCGFSESVKNRLFDPFFTTKVTGHGLGMAVVHGVIRAHKGVIYVESTEGKGSKFSVFFPSLNSSKSEKNIKPDTSGKRNLSGVTVLVTDDDAIVRNVTERILKNYEAKVLLASSAKTAENALRELGEKECIMLVDVNMPDAGSKTLLEMASLMPDKRRVILMSGYGEAVATAGCDRKKYRLFLQKPFGADRLLDAVHEVLEQT